MPHRRMPHAAAIRHFQQYFILLFLQRMQIIIYKHVHAIYFQIVILNEKED